jgi:hypothetical protein
MRLSVSAARIWPGAGRLPGVTCFSEFHKCDRTLLLPDRRGQQERPVVVDTHEARLVAAG